MQTRQESGMSKLTYPLFVLLSLGVAVYALAAYLLFPLGSLVHPDMMISFNSHAAGVYTHIFASLIALTLGPFQFSARLRQTHLHLHRYSGRTYLLAVLLGGIAGLYIAQIAFGGLVSRTGFSLLAILWLFTGTKAFIAIMAGDIATHRKWMIRNMALTFAAVTLRIYLGLFSGIGWEFESFYPWLSWLCWVPNLLLAEMIFIRSQALS